MVWDWNGTLFDDVRLCVEVINGLLSRRSMDTVSVDRYREIFDFPVMGYYGALGFDFDVESFEVVGTEFIRDYEMRKYEAGLYACAVEALDAAAAGGRTQSVLSAYRQNVLVDLIAHFGIDHYFNEFVGLDNHYAHGKLDNGVTWMTESRLSPSDVLLVGDTLHDVDVARAMKVDCVLLGRGHQARDRLEKAGVPVLEDVGALVERF